MSSEVSSSIKSKGWWKERRRCPLLSHPSREHISTSNWLASYFSHDALERSWHFFFKFFFQVTTSALLMWSCVAYRCIKICTRPASFSFQYKVVNCFLFRFHRFKLYGKMSKLKQTFMGRDKTWKSIIKTFWRFLLQLKTISSFFEVSHSQQ